MVEDELEPLITQCPNCQTRFRVAETQLQVAEGRVRCGACLTVFAGLDHLLWEEPGSFANEQEAQEALDQLLDELNVEPVADEAGQSLSEATDLPEGEAGAVTSSAEADLAVQRFDDRESWIDQKSQLYSGYEGAQVAPEYADAVDDVVDAAAEISNTEDMLELEASATDSELPERAVDVVGMAKADASLQLIDDDSEVLDGLSREEIWGSEVAAEDTAGTAAAPEPGRASLPPPAAVELPETVSFAPAPRRWWVPIFLLLELTALAALIFWFQFESWGRDAQLRPLYATACEWLSCDLPVLRDLDRLTTRHLVVRSHPDVSGALIVDAVIVNQAEFTQPFPELELRFTTVEGQLVASRRFQPGEYLDGELLGVKEMPVLTPIQLELEIIDPGGEALNYTLSFH